VVDKRREVRFLDDKDFNFGLPPWPQWELTRWQHTPPPPSPPLRDDLEDFVANVFHAIQMAH
jgi:hypothetical protein